MEWTAFGNRFLTMLNPTADERIADYKIKLLIHDNELSLCLSYWGEINSIWFQNKLTLCSVSSVAYRTKIEGRLWFISFSPKNNKIVLEG